MNTDKANKYLDSYQINDRDVFDSQDNKHDLANLLEEFKQESLAEEIEKAKKEAKIEVLQELDDYLENEEYCFLNKGLLDFANKMKLKIKELKNLNNE